MKHQYTPVAFVNPSFITEDVSEVLSGYSSTHAVLTTPKAEGFTPATMYQLPGSVPCGAEFGFFGDYVMPPGNKLAYFLYMDNEGFFWIGCKDSEGEVIGLLLGILDPHNGDHTIQIQDKVWRWRMLFSGEVFDV